MAKNCLQTSLPKLAIPSIMAFMLIGLGSQLVRSETTVTTTTVKTQETLLAQASTPVRVGEQAPNFTAVDSMGNTHRLSNFRGKLVVLEWTNHQCPFVRKHYESGNMQKLQAEATAQDVIWLSIISSAPGNQGYVESDQANQLTRERQAQPTAVLLDPEGEIGQMYKARTTPHMFVINEQGAIEYMGAIDSIPSANQDDIPKAENYVRTALNSIIANQPVNTTVTQPYGCSVKYDS